MRRSGAATSLGVGIVCGVLGWATNVSGAATPLFVIPTESALSVPPDPSGPLDVDIYVQDRAGLTQLLRVPAVTVAAGHFRYRVVQYPQVGTAVTRPWTEDTFVIDYREPAVRKAFAAWKKAAPRDRSRQSLVAFVGRFIHEGPGRGFDIASTVAARREGDCTEHAVLTVALARFAKIPARLVLGVALLRGPRRVTAYGHAWAELLEGGQWVIADAALTDVKEPVSYIPTSVMEDEGLGFAAEQLNRVPRFIEKIVVVGPAAANALGSSSP